MVVLQPFSLFLCPLFVQYVNLCSHLEYLKLECLHCGKQDTGDKRGGVGGVRGSRGEEPPQKEVKVLYTNAQSLPSKITELDAVASDLQPDIILICESWCNSNISEANLNINGYELQQDLRTDRSDTTNGIGGGGLVVYSRNGLEILSCDKVSDFNEY